ncbi:hypothetical protein [Terrilactibacillus laevilacticus]|uniref:hypothetical protein n=1 Tax=Terrilactibacillus laevilacticus TaxID=1380157 RepID=UPI0015EEDC74|nr:hypothetical protein [Terrilactibacillus laevilacticus]
MAYERLSPAAIDDILDEYGYLLDTFPNIPNQTSIFPIYKRTIKRLEVSFLRYP